MEGICEPFHLSYPISQISSRHPLSGTHTHSFFFCSYPNSRHFYCAFHRTFSAASAAAMAAAATAASTSLTLLPAARRHQHVPFAPAGLRLSGFSRRLGFAALAADPLVAGVAAKVAAVKGKGMRGVVSMAKKSVGDLSAADLKGKKVFVRADLNVPLDENQNITDDTRVRAAIPTIKHLIDNGAKVILSSHLVSERACSLSLLLFYVF